MHKIQNGTRIGLLILLIQMPIIERSKTIYNLVKYLNKVRRLVIAELIDAYNVQRSPH